MKAFYITTPIYYPNAEPHIGTAYTTITADAIARYYKLRGEKVFFLTGTDENSLKVAKTARELGRDPQEYVDELAQRFKEYWKSLRIEYNDFIRTTEERHRRVVIKVFETLKEKGYIYKGVYEGWYCIYCETFWPPSQVGEDKLCPNPECRRPLQWVQEENYFFKLSAFGDQLLKYYEKHPESIFPESRYNETVSFIKGGLNDLCITRRKVDWGIRLPEEGNYVIYVWFDALINYLSAIGYPDKRYLEYWPADIHLIGKDILRFHAVIWPAMLMGLGVELPKKIVAHGWLVSGGQKISKSKGGFSLTLRDILDRFPPDALRYYLLREGSFGQDVEVSPESFISRYNNELADDWGNLVSRTIAMAIKYLGGEVHREGDYTLGEVADEAVRGFEGEFQNFRFSMAISKVMELVDRANALVEARKPWELNKQNKRKELSATLWELLESIRVAAGLLYHILPSTSEKVFQLLGFEVTSPEALREIALASPGRGPEIYRVSRKEILFPKYKETTPLSK